MKKQFLTIFFILLIFNFVNYSKQNIDLDTQINNLVKKLKGKNVAFLTNPTGVDKKLDMLIDRIHADKQINLICFFAPEHGLRGNQQAGLDVSDYTDPITGLPVYSLYGTRKQPTAEQLQGVDILVYFIQDTGTRFYTYIWTLTWTMQACAENNVQVMIFDRPNPLNAETIEGCPNNVNNDYVGRVFPGQKIGIPQRYGMTIGEFAQMVNKEWMDSALNLININMINYYREEYFDDAGLKWVMPSPNMPTLDTNLVYPGVGIFEGSTVSEGRGTTKPFEIVGGPENIVDAYELKAYLDDQNLKGVQFRPIYFNPTFSKYEGEDCAGVEITPTDINNFQSVKTGATVLQAFLKLYPDDFKVTDGINRLFGLQDFNKMIQTMSIDEILDSCQDDLNVFKKWRENNLIYPKNNQSYIEIEK